MIGSRLGPYSIVSKLGSGGMGKATSHEGNIYAVIDMGVVRIDPGDALPPR